MIKMMVFDFDGTLVDSNRIKWGSYYKLFPCEEAIRKIIASIDLVNGTRWQIIEKILVALKEAGLVEYEDLKEQVAKLGDSYGKMVEDGILNGEGKPGAFSVLWELHEKFPIYINTGTPIEPFKRLIKKMVESGKMPKPAGIYGRRDESTEREAKERNLLEIIENEQVSPQEVVVIGDREVDRRIAEKFGCLFIGVADEFNSWAERKEDFPVVTNLQNLLKYVM